MAECNAASMRIYVLAFGIETQSRSDAMTCDAKASLISTKSKSPIPKPRRAISLWLAGTGPMPIIFGSTPAVAIPIILARGVRPYRRAASAEAISIAAAPSFTPDALPAVTVPPARTTGESRARLSIVVPARGCSSRVTTVSPALPVIVTGTISAA